MPGILTFDTTKPESTKYITHEIGATTLILRSYKVILEVASVLLAPNYLNLEIGNIIGTNYVIDDDPSARFFTLPLSPDYVVAGTGVVTQITSCKDCSLPLVMTGDLPNQFDFRVRGVDRLLIPVANLKYLMLQFEIV